MNHIMMRYIVSELRQRTENMRKCIYTTSIILILKVEFKEAYFQVDKSYGLLFFASGKLKANANIMIVSTFLKRFYYIFLNSV